MTALQRRIKEIYRHHRQRASAVGQPLDYTAVDLGELVQAALLRPCPYCRCLVTELPTANIWSVDHRVPTSRGGGHRYRNLLVCCKTCNTRKADLTEEEFRALLALVYSWPPAAQVSMERRLSSRPIYRR